MNQDNKNIIEVHDLVRRFGDFTAVDHISFNVKRGEIFAFLGPNGAGKTTTIKMLTTLLHPSEGTIALNGFDVVKHPDDTRRSFGIVFQDPSLDGDLTAYENMQFHAVLYDVPADVYKPRIEELMKMVDLWDRKDSFVREFSGGMKRRLEIARGLLHHPKVFFLDEPTLGLDPQTRNHIWSYIKALNAKEGITVFFTTHYMEEADRYATRIAIVDHGKILTDGSAQELKQKAGKSTLEDAFLELTGHAIRHEEASSAENMRQMSRMWGRR